MLQLSVAPSACDRLYSVMSKQASKQLISLQVHCWHTADMDTPGSAELDGKYDCTLCKSRGNHPRCKGCYVVHYCGAKHQKDDWAKHKAICKPIAAARKARAAWQHLPMLPAPATVPPAGLTVAFRGKPYTFHPASIERSNMLIRLCVFPADRPVPSFDQDLDAEAIELWESSPRPDNLPDDQAIEVIKVHIEYCALAHVSSLL